MNSNLKIEILGGVNEIGGNKIFVTDKHGETTILLDFGKAFKRYNEFYDFPYSYPKSVKELISLGLIPSIQNLYSRAIDLSPNPHDFDRDPEPPAYGIFISHAHLDHIGHISVLSRKFNFFMGECTAQIFEAIYKTAWRVSVDNRYDGILERTRLFKTGDRLKADSIDIYPVHVDHSVPGSYGFIIATSSGTVIYTGDFRAHGESELTFDFIEKAKRFDPEILIIESTHIDYSGFSSEREVQAKIESLIAGEKMNYIAFFSKVDVDRFYSFYQAAKKAKMPLIMDLKRWIFLQHIMRCPRLRKNIDITEFPIYVLITKSTFNTVEKNILQELLDLMPDRVILSPIIRTVRVDKSLKQKIERTQKNVQVLKSRFIYIPSIMSPSAIRHIGPPPNTVFIMASSEPVDEESEIRFEKLLNWLEIWGIPIYHVHASGHATPIDIKFVIEELNPKIVIPIHGVRPKLLANFVGTERYRWILGDSSKSLSFEC